MPLTTQPRVALTASCAIQAALANGSNRGTFNGVAYNGGAMRLSQWDSLVVIDCSGVEVRARIPVVADHSSRLLSTLGEATASIVENRIIVAGRVVPGTPEADRVFALADAGMNVSLSIGATPLRIEHVREGASVSVNGRKFVGPLDVIRQSRIDELSTVGIGADASAFAQVAAHRKDTMPPEIATEGADIQDSSVSPPSPVVAERERIQHIRATFSTIRGEDAARECDRLINGGASVEDADRVALRLIQASRPVISGVRGSSTQSADDRESLTAAVLVHSGMSDIAAKHFKPEVMTRGAAIQARAGSLLGIARESLRTAGRPEPRSQNELVEASFSTNALGGILQRAISVIALESFRTADEPWREMAQRVPLSDFKANTLTRLAGSFQFQPVGNGGELKHSTLDGETTPIRLGTSGTILTISRQTLIDDTASGLLSQIPRELAREASRVVGDNLAELLTDEEGEFFTEERGNLLEGADTALGIDALMVAIARMRKQKDKSGRALNLAPAFLLVGAENEGRARTILNSSEIRSTSAESMPSGNPAHGVAKLLVDARLGDDEWYLLSAPANAGVVVGTLNGADNANIATKETAPDVLGLTWQAFYDHAVALHEWRAVVKATGVA